MSRFHGNSFPLSANETPAEDLAAVQVDDALLNMLGSNAGRRGSASDELARVLTAWRRDVDAEPSGDLGVDVDAAVAAINAGRRR